MAGPVAAPSPEIDELARVDAVFSALASPQRRAVLRVLAEAERTAASAGQGYREPVAHLEGSCCFSAEVSACRLSERLGLAPSTVSHHMRRLLDAGLVSSRKERQWVYYGLERTALEKAARSIMEL